MARRAFLFLRRWSVGRCWGGRVWKGKVLRDCGYDGAIGDCAIPVGLYSYWGILMITRGGHGAGSFGGRAAPVERGEAAE